MGEITGNILSPGSLPLADLAGRFRREDVLVSLAAPSEYGEIEALSRSADPRDIFLPLTASLLSWFIDRNPAGPGFLVVARPPQENRVVGHFLFYAATLVHEAADGPREVPAYLYVHLYVSPEYRRRGVFATMFAFGLDVLARMGVPFAYTLPNPRSSPGFVKFGVPLLGTLPCRMAPSWPAWKAITAVTAPGRAQIDVDRADRFDDPMLAASQGTALVRGVRTAQRLDWRFAQRPGTEYGIWRVSHAAGPAGYVVTRVMDIQKYRVLAICDIGLAVFDAPTIRAVLAGIGRKVSRERVDLAMLQGGPPGSSARRALMRAGLLRVPDRLLPQPVAVFGGATSQRDSTAGLPLLDKWCLTPCDWDVF